jgi:hypothetical protein
VCKDSRGGYSLSNLQERRGTERLLLRRRALNLCAVKNLLGPQKIKRMALKNLKNTNNLSNKTTNIIIKFHHK